MNHISNSKNSYSTYTKKYPYIKTPCKIIQPNLDGKELEIVEDNTTPLTVYYDRKNNIYYNRIYHIYNCNNNFEDNNDGEAFFIIDVFLSPKTQKANKRYLLAKIQFIPTLTVAVYPLNNIFNGKAADPYFQNMFNYHCCIGNIKEKYDDYQLWFEIMSRCFDTNNKLYTYFGFQGATPLNYKWVCYEAFHIDMVRLEINNNYILRDPNDPRLYDYNFTTREAPLMSKLPHANTSIQDSSFNIIPIRTKHKPLYDRNHPDFSQCLKNIELEKKTGKNLLCHEVPNDVKYFYGWDEFIT